MDYDAVLEQVVALLQQHKRLSYRVLKLRLQLDDDTLKALKEDLIYAKHLAMDEDGKVLIWEGEAASQADQTPRAATTPSPWRLLRLPVARPTSPERHCPATGGLSGAL